MTTDPETSETLLIEQYRRLSGFCDAWRDESVVLRLAERRPEFYLKHDGGPVASTERGRASGLADRVVDCRQRHVDTMRFTTELAARMLHQRLPALLSYFGHRITNAVAKGVNDVIHALKNAAHGFCSFNYYRTRILVNRGKLDDIPGFKSH